MTDPEASGDPSSQGERDDRTDIDAAFAAIIADFAMTVPHGLGPWPAAEDIDDDAPTPPSAAAPTSTGPATSGPATSAPTTTGSSPEPPSAAAPSAVTPDGSRPGSSRAGTGAPGASRPGTAPEAGAAEEDEGYVPPDPPPFPRGDLLSRAAWCGVVGGPAFLLLAALVWRSLPTILLLVALLAFVGGFVTLVARMPQDRPEDPDDGAVV